MEKHNFYHYETQFLKDIDINNTLVFNMISFSKKAINTLLLICIIIKKLSHYI